MFKKMVKRFYTLLLAIMIIFGNMSKQVIAADSPERGTTLRNRYPVGFAIANKDLTVYHDSAFSRYKWTISAGQGFTIIDNKDRRLLDDYAYVDYSTPNGWQQGYIKVIGYSESWGFTPTWGTVAASLNTTTTLWYGENADIYQPFGMVYKDESVALLEHTPGAYWAFIEYNTNAGRKRGFVPFKYLNPCIANPEINWLNDGWVNYTSVNAEKDYVVYGGPTEKYATIGKIFKGEPIRVIQEKNPIGGKTVRYIAYKVPGDLDKAGYIFG